MYKLALLNFDWYLLVDQTGKELSVLLEEALVRLRYANVTTLSV